MRKFSYESVLFQLSGYIHHATTQEKDKVMAPWIAERLALWVIRDDVRAYGQRHMQSAELGKCLNMAWNDMDSQFQWFSPGAPLHLSIRSLLLAQIPHQRDQEMGPFGRQIDLLNRLEPNSRLYQLFEKRLGISPTDYLAMAVLFRLNSLKDMSRVLTAKYRSEMRGVFGPVAADRFYNTLLIPRETTAEQMRNVDPDEWFQPNLLYRSPFTVYDGKWFFWGRCGLDRHLEFALSDIVGASDDAAARRLFEDLFEEYVGRSLVRTGAEVLNENEVRVRFGVDGGCCDYAVLDGDSVILLEVKNKALAHTVPASATVRTYRSKLKTTVFKAADQLRNTAHFVCRAIPSATVHRVTVTYGDLFVAEADHFFDEQSTEFQSDEPVFIMSVDHMDRLVEAVRLGQCSFVSFFDDFAKRRREPADRLFALSELLNHEPYRLGQPPKHVTEIYTPFLEGMMARCHA
ncbi:hypothetical protein [Paraburkholderia phenoliruptrix]|uniref:hypothetical protein n=1 Tax=Paraburkholderia phenoliruptrix TaxID=252970 RepID=UPI0028550F1B|nr:hypothetical protein [Paraburkholderia phenoliruptrix]MDR6392602.1 hypothetical protein [Paraburkholderia phenoliruptrix]